MTEKYTVLGLVQGIGFRPSVKRAAMRRGIRGSVRNTGGAVEIVACGGAEQLAAFRADLRGIRGADITELIRKETDARVGCGFEIEESGGESSAPPLILPDIAVCGSCMEEFYNPENRRYMHPFISCTACGPRYSILSELPYDRENISMSDFEMCGICKNEYRDIKNIRCHAQTIACPDCGPRLSFTGNGEPLQAAARLLLRGGVAAIKDIGGYHFACLAENEAAAARLRRIKRRERKPFAVMFPDAGAVEEYCRVSETERGVLLSPARPIVLLKKLRDFAPGVCSESDYIGAFLPCNPVQHYLTRECGALVMTSANISGEPIITRDSDIFALRNRIGGFEILSHDRRILTPLDDSVCRVIGGGTQLIRRGRGYTPSAIEIDAKKDGAVLASGGDLKAAFCYAAGGRAYMSQHFGDLENADVYRAWESETDRLGALLGIDASGSISDLHPGYLSAAYANGDKLQHHFAHMASVIAEHRLRGSALGFVFDGTGFGEDGNIWGGEAIVYDGKDFRRAAALEYTELLGGDESAKSAELTLDCFLAAAGLPLRSENALFIRAALGGHINTAKSSSMGRLFDAVSALLRVCSYNSYEGECAIKLESAAARASKPYPLALSMRKNKWDTAALIRDIYEAYEGGADINELALGFHCAAADAVRAYAESRNEEAIILSGGVFANRILTELCLDGLAKAGKRVYINEKVPANDGGIALGQAWYALNS